MAYDIEALCARGRANGSPRGGVRLSAPAAAGGVRAVSVPPAVEGVAAAGLVAGAMLGAAVTAASAAADAAATVDAVVGTAFALAELPIETSLPAPGLLSKLTPLLILTGPVVAPDGK